MAKSELDSLVAIATQAARENEIKRKSSATQLLTSRVADADYSVAEAAKDGEFSCKVLSFRTARGWFSRKPKFPDLDYDHACVLVKYFQAKGFKAKITYEDRHGHTSGNYYTTEWAVEVSWKA